MRHLPAIDGLRAVAVLSVIAYHVGAPAGFVGVDVFFVISGYLITSILLREPGLAEFYARRARRILPAAFLVVLVTLALSFLLLPSPRDVARSAAAAGVFVANVFFQHTTGGYWAPAADSMPLLHLWSLSVEEQFYLAWPLLLLFVRRARWLWLLAGASFALYAALSYFNPEAAFYQTPARAWELAAGGLVAFGAIRPMRGGLFVVLAACLLPMPVWAAQPLAVLGATILVSSVHAGHRSVLEARPFAWIGLISYSLYLWHWPLLAIDRATRAGDAPLATKLALVAVTFVLAVLTYRYVETPFRRMRTQPRRAVAIGVACAAVLTCSAFALASRQPPAPVVIPRASVSVDYCHPWRKGTAQFQPAWCAPNAPKVVLWGDSFTKPWEGYVLRLATQQKMAAVYAVNTSCPAVIGVSLPRDTPKFSAYCRSKAEETYAYLKAHGADTLLVSAHWARMLRERPDAGKGVLAWAKGLPNVRRIIVIGATPEIRDSVEKCQALGVSCDIPRREYEASASATRAMTRELGKLPNVEVWEVGDWMCDADLCRGVRDVPLYQHDNHHISVEAAVRYQATRPSAQ